MVERQEVNNNAFSLVAEEIISRGQALIGSNTEINSFTIRQGEDKTIEVQRQPSTTIFNEADLVVIARKPFGETGFLNDVQGFYRISDRHVLIVRKAQAVDRLSGSTAVPQPEVPTVSIEDLSELLGIIKDNQDIKPE